MDGIDVLTAALGSFLGGMMVIIFCRLFLWGWLGLKKVAEVTKPMDGTENISVPTQMMIMDRIISNLNKTFRADDHKVE